MPDPKQQLSILKKTYPDPRYYLDFDTPFHLLLATILSAQCTDMVVNKTTPALFKRYKTPQDVLKSPPGELESMIRSITFSTAKAGYIRKACETLIKEFGGQVPKEINQLTTLSGVGKKTANAIQQNAFGMVNGVIVDTHVIRVGTRLGWAKSTNPEKIEQDLMKLFLKSEWLHLPHYLKAHGQKICKPKPLCDICPLNKVCPSAFKV